MQLLSRTEIRHLQVGQDMLGILGASLQSEQVPSRLHRRWRQVQRHTLQYANVRRSVLKTHRPCF